ncbi:MAG: hypothetical protein M1483_00500 [Actinobacteria bacterium]|nr:hypothetical protein [Actinomycetota bacterium]MCL6104113.1 hypothetical protein [Actinomycetota bacterium]
MERRSVLGLLATTSGLIISGGCATNTTTAKRNHFYGAAPGTPGSLPNPSLAPGTDTIPEIDHIVVVMLENHSYDSILGMLPRGDGFALGPGGVPTNTNPAPAGRVVHAFEMPTACQEMGKPVQTWNASHIQWDHGLNNGFVLSRSGYVAMGYWTGSTLPFTYALADTFPIGDRYFCSLLGQTYPNRRYLLAATSLGMVDDTSPLQGRPPRGTILEQLIAHGISWRNYYSSTSSIDVWLYLAENPKIPPNVVKIEQFYSDAQHGKLPAFSLVDPNFGTNSEENPQDVQLGDAFLSGIVNAVMHGPNWDKTLLIWVYDEHGGYYDHVPPPPAVKPDNVAPEIKVPPDQPGSFDRYGFRVPMGVVCPYAKPNYVSTVVHDHTSILKLIETKWNLPALTYRDQAADNLLDFVDFKSAPAFLDPPRLSPPVSQFSCTPGDPGQIPPVGAVT